MMELRDIKSFIEVANHQSFTKAAEHSYLSQPSLSKAVKKLEDELHVELFDRSTRTSTLDRCWTNCVYARAKSTCGIIRVDDYCWTNLTDAEVR